MLGLAGSGREGAEESRLDVLRFARILVSQYLERIVESEQSAFPKTIRFEMGPPSVHPNPKPQSQRPIDEAHKAAKPVTQAPRVVASFRLNRVG